MPASEVVDLLACDDPVAAFIEADGSSRPIALPTSGTAARPRTIVRTTESWSDSFAAVSELTDLDASSRVWVPGPTTATMNLFATIHARWAGATLAPDLGSATHAHLTPTALRRLLDAVNPDLAGRHLVVAGDRIEAGTRARIRAAGAEMSHYYGAAELSFVAWGEHADALRPFPGVEVTSRDGELWVRSPYVSRGYLEPEHTLRHDADGWVTVGDRGDLTDGCVRVHGRSGGITTGGTTVRTAEIEHALRPRATGDVVVLGLPHPDLGEVVAAVVTHPEDVQHLQALSRDVLTAAQRPRRWLQVDALPLTGHDKVDRVALRAAFAAARAER
ncbi:AMP-binding protein [Janibacter sp. GS2]|uniref:AMP-binding protein n=1 Tax=Janibacter sp. GS2 TaxID=3442646 RepID=UPI003EBB975B